MIRNCYRINKAGNLKRLIRIDESLTDPHPGEVAIEVKSIGLNFADVFCILGLYSATPKESFVPGLEFSGVVIKKGNDVNGINIADKVMGVIRFGSYATHLNIDCRYLLKLPDGWTFAEGAAFIVNSLTAYYALIELGNLKEDMKVLINSAAGGVGIYANRIAKKRGAFTIGTVGIQSKINKIEREGYDELIVLSYD